MSILTPGFASAAEAQSCFRSVLRALSAPGEIVALKAALEPPAQLSPAAAAILLTLTDPFVSVSLPDWGEEAWAWLNFHARARQAGAREADFVVASARPRLADLRRGTDEAPQDGATLILECAGFGAGRRCRLTGPGIEAERVVALPLDEGFVAEWRAQAQIAPRGVDVILCAGREMVGLPRSVRIEEV